MLSYNTHWVSRVQLLNKVYFKMSTTNQHPIVKLPELQYTVYEAVKQCQPTTVSQLLVYLPQIKKNSLASALRSLRNKDLIVYEKSIYKITDNPSFQSKNKKPVDEPYVHPSHIQDQLEWNQQILQQKALREARMRINL